MREINIPIIAYNDILEVPIEDIIVPVKTGNYAISVNLPQGVSFVRAVLPKGTFDQKTMTWNTGYVEQGETLDALLYFKVEDDRYVPYDFKFYIAGSPVCDRYCVRINGLTCSALSGCKGGSYATDDIRVTVPAFLDKTNPIRFTGDITAGQKYPCPNPEHQWNTYANGQIDPASTPDKMVYEPAFNFVGTDIATFSTICYGEIVSRTTVLFSVSAGNPVTGHQITPFDLTNSQTFQASVGDNDVACGEGAVTKWLLDADRTANGQLNPPIPTNVPGVVIIQWDQDSGDYRLQINPGIRSTVSFDYVIQCGTGAQYNISPKGKEIVYVGGTVAGQLVKGGQGYKLHDNPTTTVADESVILLETGDAPVPNALYIPRNVFSCEIVDQTGTYMDAWVNGSQMSLPGKVTSSILNGDSMTVYDTGDLTESIITGRSIVVGNQTGGAANPAVVTQSHITGQGINVFGFTTLDNSQVHGKDIELGSIGAQAAQTIDSSSIHGSNIVVLSPTISNSEIGGKDLDFADTSSVEESNIHAEDLQVDGTIANSLLMGSGYTVAETRLGTNNQGGAVPDVDHSFVMIEDGGAATDILPKLDNAIIFGQNITCTGDEAAYRSMVLGRNLIFDQGSTVVETAFFGHDVNFGRLNAAADPTTDLRTRVNDSIIAGDHIFINGGHHIRSIFGGEWMRVTAETAFDESIAGSTGVNVLGIDDSIVWGAGPVTVNRHNQVFMMGQNCEQHAHQDTLTIDTYHFGTNQTFINAKPNSVNAGAGGRVNSLIDASGIIGSHNSELVSDGSDFIRSSTIMNSRNVRLTNTKHSVVLGIDGGAPTGVTNSPVTNRPLGAGTNAWEPASVRNEALYLGNAYIVRQPHRNFGTVFTDDIGPGVVTAITSSNRGVKITVNNPAVFGPYNVGDGVRLTDTMGSWHTTSVLGITGSEIELRIPLTDVDDTGTIGDMVIQRIGAGNVPFTFNDLELLARSNDPADDGRVELVNRDTFTSFVEDVINANVFPGELVLMRDITTPTHEGWKLRQNPSRYIGDKTINLMPTGHARISNAIYLPDVVLNESASYGTSATNAHILVGGAEDVTVRDNHAHAAFLGLNNFTTNAARTEVVYMGNAHIVRQPHRNDGNVYGTRITVNITSKVVNAGGGTDLQLAGAPTPGQGFDVGDTIRITDSVGSRHITRITAVNGSLITVDVDESIIDDTTNAQMIAEDITTGNVPFAFDHLEILARNNRVSEQGRVEVLNRDTFTSFVNDVLNEKQYGGMLIRERNSQDPTKEGYKVRLNPSTIIGNEAVNLKPSGDAPLDATLYTPESIIADSKFKSSAALSSVAVLGSESIDVTEVHSYAGIIGINGGANGWSPHSARSEVTYVGQMHLVRDPHRDNGTIYVDPTSPGDIVGYSQSGPNIELQFTPGLAVLQSYGVGNTVRFTDTIGAWHVGGVIAKGTDSLTIGIPFDQTDMTGNIGDAFIELRGIGNRQFSFDNLELLARSTDATDDGRVEVVNRDTFTKFVEDVVAAEVFPGEVVLVRDGTDINKEGYKLRQNPTTVTGQHTVNLKPQGDAPIDEALYVPSVVLSGDVTVAQGKTIRESVILASPNIQLTEDLVDSAIIGISGVWGPSYAKPQTTYVGNLNIVRQPDIAKFSSTTTDHTLDQAAQRTSGQNVIVTVPQDVNALYNVGDQVYLVEPGNTVHTGVVVGKSLSTGTQTHTEIEVANVATSKTYATITNLTQSGTKMVHGNMELLCRSVSSTDGEVRVVSSELMAEFGKQIPLANLETVTVPSRGPNDGEALVYHSATSDWRPTKIASGVLVSTTVPDADQQDEGTLFFNPNTGKLYIVVNTAWIQINA